MKLLLTSAGINNDRFRDALGKPIADSNALCIPTAAYRHPQVSPEGAWLVEVFPDAPHRARDVRCVASLNGQVPEPGALLASQQPVDDLPLDDRHEDWSFRWRIYQTEETHNRILQVLIEQADIHRADIHTAWRRYLTRLL